MSKIGDIITKGDVTEDTQKAMRLANWKKYIKGENRG